MSKTVVMTLRLPANVARGVERLAARFGHKPAQLGARLVEEGVRRRDFPHVDLRETTAGRIAYLGGTRFAVHWVAQTIEGGTTAGEFAKEYELPVETGPGGVGIRGRFPRGKSRLIGSKRRPTRNGLNSKTRRAVAGTRREGGGNPKGKRQAVR